LKNPLVLKLQQYDALTPEEISVIERIVPRPHVFAAGTDIVVEQSRPPGSSLIIDGFASRYKVNDRGQRNITALHFTGDFVDLHALLLRKMDHSVGAITDCKVAIIDHGALREVTQDYPHLTRLLWLGTLVDAAIHRQWLAIARNSALKRAAHLMCEMLFRGRPVGLSGENSFRLPITQSDLGDALGLSTVHTNRTLQELRALGLLSWVKETVSVHDVPALIALAEFDPTYLSQRTEPR